MAEQELRNIVPTVDGVRNFVAWGWTDADLYRAADADPGRRDEYLTELALRRREHAAMVECQAKYESEVLDRCHNLAAIVPSS